MKGNQCIQICRTATFVRKSEQLMQVLFPKAKGCGMVHMINRSAHRCVIMFIELFISYRFMVPKKNRSEMEATLVEM